MFDRFTERARRVIFFARFEASKTGCHAIRTEHLFLGLLRENRYLLPEFPPDSDLAAIRSELFGEAPAEQLPVERGRAVVATLVRSLVGDHRGFPLKVGRGFSNRFRPREPQLT